jgi:hypothetical protein
MTDFHSGLDDDDMRLFLKECILSGAVVRTLSNTPLDPNEINNHLYADVYWPEGGGVAYWVVGGTSGECWVERRRYVLP